MNNFQYGGGNDMEAVFDSVCVGDGTDEHYKFLRKLNDEYDELIKKIEGNRNINTDAVIAGLSEDGFNLMNIRMLYLVLNKLGLVTSGGATENLYGWPIGKKLGPINVSGVRNGHLKTELNPPELTNENITDQNWTAEHRTAWSANGGRQLDGAVAVVKWGVPAFPYIREWDVTDGNATGIIEEAHVLRDIYGVVDGAVAVNSVPGDPWEWLKRMQLGTGGGRDLAVKSLYKLLNSFRNFIYLKNFVNKEMDYNIREDEYIKITCERPITGLRPSPPVTGLNMVSIFKTNLTLMGLMEESYINGPQDNHVFFTNQLDHTNGTPNNPANYFQVHTDDLLANVEFSFGVDGGGGNYLDILNKIYDKYDLSADTEKGIIKKYAFHIFTMRNPCMHPQQILPATSTPAAAAAWQSVFRKLFPYFCQEVEDIVSMRKALVDSVVESGNVTVKIAHIKKCLKGMADTWGAASLTPTDVAKTLKDGRKDRENLSDDDSSGEVSGPLRKLKILNTFFEEYLSFTSLPTDESSYDVIESFVKNIYKALYDADKSGVIELKNPTEVSEIVKNDPRSKNGFSNKGTSWRLREYNKKARHITIRLVAMDSDNDYSKLPGHKSMYDTLKGDNFELLSEFTLQLFKNINLKPTDITEYFQNLGDTEIKKTNNSFEITYIVESQYSMLNLTKSGRTTELVERLRDDLRRIGKVKLEELGGEYAITVLGREDKGERYERGSGENVITDSQLVGDGVIFKIEDKHAQITGAAVNVYEEFAAAGAAVDAISKLKEFLNLFNVVEGVTGTGGNPIDWILAGGGPSGNVVEGSYLYFNEKLEEHPSFKTLKDKCLSDNPCVLEKINDKSLYDNGQWPENGKISITKLKLKISEFPQARDAYTGDRKWSGTFTFRPLKSTTGGGIGSGMHSLLYGGAGTEDGDDSVPEETEDPTNSKMHGTWENITTSSKQKTLLRNLSEYTISPDYINKRAAKELIQQNKVLKDKMVSRRAEMFGISNEPNPSDQNDQGDGDGTNNTESEEMKKIKEELKKQRELQAKALESQNKKALLDAQNQSTQLQQKLNQLANKTTNTNSGQQVRPSQTPAAPSSARPGQPPPARPGPPSPARPGQQPVKPGQQPVKPGKQPVKPNEKSSESDLPNESGQPEKKEPSFMDRLFSSSSDKDKEKDDFQKEKEDFQKEKEKQQEDEQKKKEMEERMEKLKKEEVIQTDLFKQLPHKSSPEYEKVKKLMIEQIKLIHKYNLLRQESFQLMLENSKYENLEYENKEQKELIKDLENKMFSIIQQILSSKTSNKNLNKLNSDLLSYIDDLKSNDPDGSLVDTDKYIELIESFKSSTKKRTLKKQKRLSNKKKGEKKKRTLKKLRQKLTPKKIKKKTPTKSKKITKVKRTPTKSKNFNKIQRTPTNSKK